MPDTEVRVWSTAATKIPCPIFRRLQKRNKLQYHEQHKIPYMYSGNKCIKQKGPIKMKKIRAGFFPGARTGSTTSSTHKKNHVPKEEPLICG